MKTKLVEVTDARPSAKINWAVRVLNDLLRVDPTAVKTIFEARADVTTTLDATPDDNYTQAHHCVWLVDEAGNAQLGPLGILNGILSVAADRMFLIVAQTNSTTGDYERFYLVERLPEAYDPNQVMTHLYQGRSSGAECGRLGIPGDWRENEHWVRFENGPAYVDAHTSCPNCRERLHDAFREWAAVAEAATPDLVMLYKNHGGPFA